MTVASLIEQWHKGNRAALSRLLTLAARGEQLAAISAAARTAGQRVPTCRTIAITGSGGVGKSTLAGGLISVFRQQHDRVAVLACDPESPLTGGALLGDRLRMTVDASDQGVFIRSLATPGGRQALAEHLDLMVALLAGSGFAIVLLETVGAGQGDTAVRRLADVVAMLVQPEAGDDVQWEKAGLLEVADVVVVNKADLPGADRTESQVRSLLNLPGCREIPVVRVSSTKKTGLTELARLLKELPSRRDANHRSARDLLRLAQDLVAARFQKQAALLAPIAEAWQSNALTDEQAAAQILRRLATDI